jgi:hypothetical protein
VALLFKAPVEALPLVVLLPLQLPEALQFVALVELQVKVLASPAATVEGVALMLIAGAGVTSAGP